jgi:hypothetical protein
MQVYQISPDINYNGYLYAASSSGILIIDIATETEYAHISSTTCTSVWNSDTLVFMGTTNSGIYALAKSDIGAGDLTSLAYQYKTYPTLTSDNIKYLHGQSDYLCATTAAGVDFVWISLNDQNSRIIANTYKCFVCTDGKTYYTTSGTPHKIYRSNVPSVQYPSVTYVCGSGDLTRVVNVQDIYVTEGTSSVDTVLWPENTLFIAASGSAFIYDEGSGGITEYSIGG